MIKTLVIAIVVSIIAFAAGVWYTREYNPAPIVETPNITPTSTPVETPKATYSNASSERIVVDLPKPGEAVASTFTVVGKARGGWYFESSFPLRVLSSTGSLLKEMPVQADGEWMTAEFVPFSETVTLPADYKGAAILILKNDNPSGLPENDASISIPITIQ